MIGHEASAMECSAQPGVVRHFVDAVAEHSGNNASLPHDGSQLLAIYHSLVAFPRFRPVIGQNLGYVEDGKPDHFVLYGSLRETPNKLPIGTGRKATSRISVHRLRSEVYALAILGIVEITNRTAKILFTKPSLCGRSSSADYPKRQ
jgi:hypothetical protein